MKRFHAFRLDSLNQCLWRGEQRVPITPKAFDVLRYLVEHPGRLVTQEQILEALWPGTYVNQEVIKKYILGIRKVLQDRHDKPMFIETLPRRGYRFVAPVIDESAAVATWVASVDAGNKMVGREAALAALEAALERALRGRRQVVFVTGEAGIGKTTLVDVFQQRATPHTRIARGQCVEGFGGKEAYYPMLEALGQLTRGDRRSPIVQTLAARAPTWVIQLPSLITPEQRAALQREILGATRERMVREICEALEALTAERPLLFVFEDLHWVDPSTLDFVSALARRREPARLMLLSTYRPADVALSHGPLKRLKEDLQVHQLCEEIALGHLQESEVAKYLASEFATGSLPSELAGLISQRSGGNALFMVAMVQDMVKKGLILQDEGAWRLSAPLAAIDPGVPETLQHMLEVQLEQLSVTEQRVLRSASVAGDRFSAWAVATTLDATPEEVEDLCEALAERQQVIKSAGLDELADGSVSAHYEFRHSMYRQVIYRQLSEVGQARLHRKLGEGLDSLCGSSRRKRELAAEISLHFERGREYQRAIRYLTLAAENAAGRFAYRDAIDVLQHTLELARKHALRTGAEPEIQILELIGDAHYALGAMEDSARAYSAAAERAAKFNLRAAQVNALTCLMRPFGLIDPDRGIAAVEQAARVSTSLDDARLVACTQMLAAATRLLYDAWRTEDADLCASAHETLRKLGDAGTPAYHQMMYAYVLALQGHYREACGIFETFLTRENGSDSLMTYHFALGGKTVALLHLGQFGEVLRIVRAAREAADKNGNDPWLFNFREAWLRTLALDFTGARRLGESIVRDKPDYQTGQPETIARIAAGYAELEAGNYDQAIEYFSRAGDPQVTPKFFQHWLWRMESQRGLSEVSLASGDLAKARNGAEAFLESALSTANPCLRTQAWEMRSRIAMAERDWIGAQEYVGRALAVLEKFEIPVAAWRVESTAWDLSLHAKDYGAAETHRARAETHILAIANSFAPDEPLRHSFLAAAPVSRILNGGKAQNRISS